MFKYFPQTSSDIKKMLEKIGINEVEELFNDIPREVYLNDLNKFNLPRSLSEIELRKDFDKIAQKNKPLNVFCGGGAYDVYTPSVIDYITSRQEFLTSYTPYQAEISQGTLKYIFEYQSLVCELTGMDVANASMYDGATATCEAILMACVQTKRKKALISKTINRNYLECIKTYLKVKEIEIELIDQTNDLLLDENDLINKLNSEIACVVVNYPNYYGYIEKYNNVERIKQNKSLFIVCSDISTLALIKSPRELGADIACGDCQALGIPLSNGGPYLGYLATLDAYKRKMPGRIVGMTTDSDDKRGFVLTLQAREQHIKRERATSNICSNQSLMCLHVMIYSALLGKKGLKETQLLCYQNSHYLKEQLLKSPLFEKVTDNDDFIKEFTLKVKVDSQKLNKYLENNGYLGGISLENNLYVLCATETKTKEELDDFIKVVGEYHE